MSLTQQVVVARPKPSGARSALGGVPLGDRAAGWVWEFTTTSHPRYPASADDADTEAILSAILELGVDTFVCLQAEFSLNSPETAWRSGQALRPYVKDAQRLLVSARNSANPKISQKRLDLLHLPIVDGSVTSDYALSRLADDCCQRILDGERLYIHCWGGHGRTGTLVAVMLARLYGLTTATALDYTQALHDVRKYPQNVRSPQTQVQVEQVRRILGSERIGEKGRSYRWPTQPLWGAPAGMGLTPKRHPPSPSIPAATQQLMAKANLAAAAAGVMTAKAAAVVASGGLDPPVRQESLIPAGRDGGAQRPGEAVVGF